MCIVTMVWCDLMEHLVVHILHHKTTSNTHFILHEIHHFHIPQDTVTMSSDEDETKEERTKKYCRQIASAQDDIDDAHDTHEELKDLIKDHAEQAAIKH